MTEGLTTTFVGNAAPRLIPAVDQGSRRVVVPIPAGLEPRQTQVSMAGNGSALMTLLAASGAAAASSSAHQRRRRAACKSANRSQCKTVACRAEASTADAPAIDLTGMALSEIPEESIINDNGFVLPVVPEGTKASAFLILDMSSKPQYIGFSKDLRNTLRTLLCRRPELCYRYKCTNFEESDQKKLMALRTAWIAELGVLPPGNKDPRQKNFWESPVDGGALNERAWKTVAEGKGKQIVRQLKDRDCKETIEWKEDLILLGKVDPKPSFLSCDDVQEQQKDLASRTTSCEYTVAGKLMKFEVFFMAKFPTKGGWMFDVELSHQKMKTTHRIIVGKDFLANLPLQTPEVVVEKAFAVLLANKAPRKTEGLITSEIFPVNYFTVTNVVVSYPVFLELLGKKANDFDWHGAQWTFKQVHDYSEDKMRTIPAGPGSKQFDPKRTSQSPAEYQAA